MTRDNDGPGYWRQFETVATFDAEGDTVEGVIVEMGLHKFPNEFLPAPKLRIQTDDGRVIRVVVTNERLLSALSEACPVRGDRVTIRYTGNAARAARGMTPAKLFKVTVVRPGERPMPRPRTPDPALPNEAGKVPR